MNDVVQFELFLCQNRTRSVESSCQTYMIDGTIKTLSTHFKRKEYLYLNNSHSRHSLIVQDC